MVKVAFANSINIECDFDYIRSDKFKEYVKTCNSDANQNCRMINPEEYFKKYAWYNFLSERKQYFSIDTETKHIDTFASKHSLPYSYYVSSALQGLFIGVSMISFEEKLDEEKFAREKVTIDRIDGSFYGTTMDPKTGKELYGTIGSCKQLKRLF